MISVNRALSELKLVTKKIEQKTGKIVVAGGFKNSATKDENDAFIKEAKSSIQQAKDLLERRNKLKQAIVMSNATTKVSIDGKEMTVAEAIEKKASIELTKEFSKKLREEYYGNKNGVEQHNTKVSADADKKADVALGAATEGDKGVAYKAIVDAYKLENGAKLVAPEGIEKEIEDLQDEIDNFESEVDFVLSESNVKTMIDV